MQIAKHKNPLQMQANTSPQQFNPVKCPGEKPYTKYGKSAIFMGETLITARALHLHTKHLLIPTPAICTDTD